VTRPWIGIAGADLNPQLARRYGISKESGFLVAELVQGSPAHLAGLRAGDVIIAADAAEVKQTKDLLLAISKVAEGETMNIEVDRRGTTLMLRVRPAEAQKPTVRFRRE